MSERFDIEEVEGSLMFVEVLGNISDETGRVVYSYVSRVVQDVMGIMLVGEGTIFNSEECGKIKKRLLEGPLDCSFTDRDECKLMSLAELLLVFNFRRPIPEDLPQYR